MYNKQTIWRWILLSLDLCISKLCTTIDYKAHTIRFLRLSSNKLYMSWFGNSMVRAPLITLQRFSFFYRFLTILWRFLRFFKNLRLIKQNWARIHVQETKILQKSYVTRAKLITFQRSSFFWRFFTISWRFLRFFKN